MSWFDRVNNTSSSLINLANETLSSESVRNIQQRFFNKSTATSFSPSQFGVLCGILIAVLVNEKTSKQLQKNVSRLRNIYGLALIRISVTSLVLLPIFLTSFGILLIYRSAVRIILQIQFGDTFRGFLAANDAVWTVEHQSWKSVINILALFEQRERKTENFSEGQATELLNLIRKKFEDLTAHRSEAVQKIFYCLNRKFGYSFWTAKSYRIEDYVKLVDIPSPTSFLTTDAVKTWLGEVSNDLLPKDHTLLWEIIVSKKPVCENGSIKYPVICRVHHSLGDGVALLRFFLESIADQDNKPHSVFLDTLKPASNSSFKLDIRASINNAVNWINLITSIPSYLSQQFSTCPDSSSLHGTTLSGAKTCSYIYESDNSYLLIHLRKLKRMLPNTRLSDLILTALSASLYSYYERTKTAIPQSIHIILPARIEPLTKDLKLENKFSVALQKLPILPPLKEGFSFRDLSRRVVKVKVESDRVRSGSEYLINYAIMTVFGYLLPYPVLKRIFDSKLVTMVFSNLPGPSEEAVLGDYRITNLSFSVPHRDTTGIGLTLLTYSGKMQITLCADRALISSSEGCQRILQDLENEIKNYCMLLVNKTI